MKVLQFIRTHWKLDVAVVVALLGISGYAAMRHSQLKAAENRTVMITNLAKNGGGTGSILRSSANKSTIITNKHVCGVLPTGGIVSYKGRDYLVDSYQKDSLHDLCLIHVSVDLGQNGVIASQAPNNGDSAFVAGHPGLLPLTITTGHVSDYKIIEIMTGVRKCTEEDQKDPVSVILCAFLGRMPITTKYQSRLVTATIMPGSSGSAIYNNSGEIIGLVFAGSGELSYALTVPWEYVDQFVKNASDSPMLFVNNTSENKAEHEAEHFKRETRVLCNSNKDVMNSRACQLVEKGYVVQ